MKKINLYSLILVSLLVCLFTGCGNKEENFSEKNLEGTMSELLSEIYEDADLTDEFRESLNYYYEGPIEDDSMEYILGTKDVEFSDSVYSAPMMSSVAYQCVLLRVPEESVYVTKTKLKECADSRKWLCVEAESIVIENRGDVILYVMADEITANAMEQAFLNLN